MTDYHLIAYKYTEYARGVLDGSIKAGKYIQLACERYLSWFERDDIYFNVELMMRVENVISHMSHFEGNFNKKHVVLNPFQWFIICNIFAWFYVKSPIPGIKHKRVVSDALIFIARKNGKSALAAMIAICDLLVANGYCNDSGVSAGYEGYTAANSLEQSKILFKFLKGYTKSLDPQQKHFKHYRNYIQYTGKKGKSDGILKPLAADAMTLDGLNPDLALIDELHAATDDSLVEVLATGMMSKPNGLRIIISSGGVLGTEGFPLYDRIQIAHRRLNGQMDFPDSQFYALFELDENDDWQDPANFIKANPGLDDICFSYQLEDALTEAKTIVSKQINFKIKNLDIFCQSADVWISNEMFNSVAVDVDLSRLDGEYCYAGVDLSSTGDLTSYSLCFPPNQMREYYPDKYILKTFCWVPAKAAKESSNSALYQVWISGGHLKKTNGNSVDYDEILNDILNLNSKMPLIKMHYDAWNSTSFIQNATAEGVPAVPMSQSLGSFNRGSKSLEIFINNNQIVIDNNPVVRWCFTNATLKVDMYGNIKPIKPAESKKIDCLISSIEALSAPLFEQAFGQMEIFTLHRG